MELIDLNDSELTTTLEQKQKRIDICVICEHNNGTGGCTQCGCPISLLTTFTFKSCPIGKW